MIENPIHHDRPDHTGSAPMRLQPPHLTPMADEQFTHAVSALTELIGAYWSADMSRGVDGGETVLAHSAQSASAW